MDARCHAAAADDKANTGCHRDASEAGESETPSMVGRIPPAKHGARRSRRSRSLPPTTNGHGGHDADAGGAPRRTTTDGMAAAASPTTATSQAWDAEPAGGKRFLISFELPSSTEELLLLLPFVLLAPCCPWRAATDQPAAMISRISWVSLLFCLYLFFLIAATA